MYDTGSFGGSFPGPISSGGGTGSFAPVQSWKKRLQNAFAKGGEAIESVVPGENPAEVYGSGMSMPQAPGMPPGMQGQGGMEGLPFQAFGPGGMGDTMPTGGDPFSGLQTPGMPPSLPYAPGGAESFGPSGFGAPPGFGSQMPQSPLGIQPGMGMNAMNPRGMQNRMWAQ